MRREESGMVFEYSDDEAFDIEWYAKSKKLALGGVKSCEVVLLRGRKLYFIEAKSTSPNELEASSTEEKEKKYENYISDILEKMRHSMALFSAVLLHIHEPEGVPEGLLDADFQRVKIHPVLIVAQAKEEWLIGLQQKLNQALKVEKRIWNCEMFAVINAEIAKRKQLIK